MKKQIALVLMVMLWCNMSTKAFGWDGHYHYREGRYYSEAGWWGLGGFVTGLAVGAYVTSLPPRYETVVVAGVPYYYADGYYYETGPGGYVVVAPPAVVAPQVVGGQTNAMVYILGTLLAIVLLAFIILFIKKISA